MWKTNVVSYSKHTDKKPITNYVTHFWLFFDHSPHGYVLALISLINYLIKAFNSYAFPDHPTMGVFIKICPFRENINFGFFQFLESYWVENTQNLTRSQKITLRNSFGCLKIVSKVRAKPRFSHSFMYFTIKGR